MRDPRAQFVGGGIDVLKNNRLPYIKTDKARDPHGAADSASADRLAQAITTHTRQLLGH